MTARPISLTKEMKLAAALKLAADVRRDCPAFRDEDITELAEQIAREARGPYMDGYELAKALDDHCGWQPDSTMVETLDMWSRHAGDELRAAQKAWRNETNPQPAFKVDGVLEEAAKEVECILIAGYGRADTAALRKLREFAAKRIRALQHPDHPKGEG